VETRSGAPDSKVENAEENGHRKNRQSLLVPARQLVILGDELSDGWLLLDPV
jgi:hypothetical protein